tara:strand:+ start:1338 stop:2210 length:873 start_codon:yes stop_codon:yes gene_type:complete
MEPRIAATPITWGFAGNNRWGIDLPQERILSEMVQVGFNATETGVPGFLPHDGIEARAILEKHGLRATSGPVSFVIHEEGSRQSALETVRKAGHRLVTMGGEVLITVPKPGNRKSGEQLDEDGWKRLCEGLDAIEELCRSMGLEQALHPHVGSLVETKEDMRRIMESSACGWCLDTAHIASGDLDPSDFLAMAGERVTLIHVKDLNVDLGRKMVQHKIAFDAAIRKKVFVPLGDGDLDLSGIIPLLPKEPWWVVEQDQGIGELPKDGSGPMSDARTSLNILRGLLGSSNG